MRTDLPIIARLTPDAAPAAPAGYVSVDSPIRGGLPHAVPLIARWRALLSLPTGTARIWLDTAAATPVTDGAPRLRLQRDGVTVAIAPLVLGPLFDVTDAGGRLRLTMIVLGWSLHAGDLRGAGDHGSVLRLAYAAADRAADVFAPLPPSDFIIRALPPADRTESRGREKHVRFDEKYARYNRLKQYRLLRAKDNL